MSPTDAEPLNDAPAASFAAELEREIEPVRQAFRGLLGEWGWPATAADFDRMTKAGATICWQVFRIGNSSDPVAEARHVPTPSSLRRLLAAATSAGLPADVIAAVDQAARRFDAFRKQAASDRSAFDSMLAGVAPEEVVAKIPLALRRTAYRAISSINGVQTDLIYTAALVRAGATPEVCDQVTLYMHQGIRRLRPDAQLYLHSYVKNPSAMPDGLQAENPLDEAAAKTFGMPILPEFSMTPPPAVARIEQPPGFVSYSVTGREIGLPASIDCTFGRYTRNAPLERDTDGRLLYHSSYSYFRRPAALGIHEVLVHRPSYPQVRPQQMVYQYRDGNSSQAAARSAQQYPLDLKLVKVGRADVAASPDLPRYGELLRFAAGKVGWNLSEFDVYRFRLPFPIVFSTERIFFGVS